MRLGIRLLPLVMSLLLVQGAAVAATASQFDPALRFRVSSTDHFLIYFHQDEESLARRLAVIAADTWCNLWQPLVVTPPLLTHVVLVDQTDLSSWSAASAPL